MLAPLDRTAVAAQSQWAVITLGVLLQHPHIELDHVPADDSVRVVAREPGFQAVEQCETGVAVFEVEVGKRRALDVAAIRRAEHIDLALAAALERDRAQLALESGLDVERHGTDRRPVAGRRLEGRIDQQQRVAVDRRAGKADRRGDEAFHQVALGWSNVALEDVEAVLAQVLLDAHQLPVLAAVQAGHRAMAKIEQVEGTQLPSALVDQQLFDRGALFFGDEGDRGLDRQSQAARAGIGGDPEFDFAAGGGVAPVTRQKKTSIHQRKRCNSASVKPAWRRPSILNGPLSTGAL